MTAGDSSRKTRRNLQSTRKAGRHHLYSSDDVIKLYEISRNTLTNWIAEGLRVIDAQPRLFRGADLNEFHSARKQKAAGEPLGQFMVKCFGCKRNHSLLEGEISVLPGRTPGVFRVLRNCPDTGKIANRYFCSDELRTLRAIRETNPGRQTPD